MANSTCELLQFVLEFTDVGPLLHEPTDTRYLVLDTLCPTNDTLSPEWVSNLPSGGGRMSDQSALKWRPTPRTIGTLAGRAILVLTFIFGSGFLYQNLVNVPDVVYTILPTYELGGQSFGGLVVENRGRATGHDVRISLGDLGTSIVQHSVQSDERWIQEEGGAGESTLVLWLDRMITGSSVTVYLLTQEVARLDGLAVITEEGRVHLATGQSIASLGAPVALGALFGGLVASVVWYLFYTRLKLEREMWRKSAENATEVVVRCEKLVGRLEDQLKEWESGKRFPPRPKIPR